MNRQRRTRKTYNEGPHLFTYDTYSFIRYTELMKESRIWNNMGQYYLGKQAELLAQKLLNGDTSSLHEIVRTESLYI